MARIYREIVIEQMILTVGEAMSRVIDWWGDLPPSMKVALDEFRAQIGAAIDSAEFVNRALDTPAPKTECEEGFERRRPVRRHPRGHSARRSEPHLLIGQYSVGASRSRKSPDHRSSGNRAIVDWPGPPS